MASLEVQLAVAVLGWTFQEGALPFSVCYQIAEATQPNCIVVAGARDSSFLLSICLGIYD